MSNSARICLNIIALGSLIALSSSLADARGGMGFHGGGGGELRGDYGMRTGSFGDFDRGFDHPDFGRMDDDYRRADDVFGPGVWGGRERPDAFMSPGDMNRAPAGDNGVRDYGAQRNLASDGGFSSIFHGAPNSVARGNQTMRVTPAGLANQAGLVRHNFNNYNLFNHNWWANHPYSWWHNGWDNYWPWRWSSWPELAGWWGWGLGAAPIYYDYGDNITYDDNGYVDYGSSPVCTAADYYQQSCDLANSTTSDDFGASASGDEPSVPPQSQTLGSASLQPVQSKAVTTGGGDWKPFGVYSLVQGGQSSSSTLFQLCTNKKGQIRGNYYNALTNETQPVKGAVDKKTMRAAWTVGKNNAVVYDTGVANLLKDQSPVLIHFGKDSTQQWTLVRIKNPNADSKQKA